MSLPRSTQTIEMIPLAMRIPNEHSIYSVSKLRQPFTICQHDLAHYVQCKINVCLVDAPPSEDELLANAVFVTVYGSGLDCWYAKASDIKALQNGAYSQESDLVSTVSEVEPPAYIDLSGLPAFQYWQIDHELTK